MLAAFLAGVWMTPGEPPPDRPTRSPTSSRDSGARVLIADDEHAALARGAARCRRHDPRRRRSSSARSPRRRDEPLPLDGPAGGTMIYTSGTTGHPKGVKRRAPASSRAALAGHEAYGALDRARRPRPAPRDRPALPRGAAHVRDLRPAERRADRRDAALGRARVPAPRRASTVRRTRTSCRPCSCGSCASRRGARRLRPAPLRTVLHGAAPIAPAVKERMIEWWGPVLARVLGRQRGRRDDARRLARVARARRHRRARACRTTRSSRSTSAGSACRPARRAASTAATARAGALRVPRRPRRRRAGPTSTPTTHSRSATSAASTRTAACSSPTASRT